MNHEPGQADAKEIKSMLISLMVILLTACGDPAIDAASDKTMTATLVQVRQSLPAEQRKVFDESIKLIDDCINDPAFMMTHATLSSLQTKITIHSTLHGKSGRDVIAMGEKIRSMLREEDNGTKADRKAVME